MFDSHVHTHCSIDSDEEIEAICRAAAAKGFRGITVTDHANMSVYQAEETLKSIRTSLAEAAAAGERYRGVLRVLRGVELAEALSFPACAEEILRLTNYDAVLGSCHFVAYEDWNTFYSAISFAEPASAEKIQGFLTAYFADVYRIAQKADFDVLCHLTCPVRYINGKYGRGISLEPHYPIVTAILKAVIRRERSLEVNTSGLGQALNATMPDEAILRLYYSLGGRRITLGSDAHVAQNVGNGFKEAVAMLKAIGFTGCTHYEQRRPVFESWEKAEEGLRL